MADNLSGWLGGARDEPPDDPYPEADPYQPATPMQVEQEQGEGEFGATDLSYLLGGDVPEPPEPDVGETDDGGSLFYSGRANVVAGDPESAKTWIALAALVPRLHCRQDRVAVIDVDDNGHDEIVRRLIALGARPEDLADPDRFRLYEPGSGLEFDVAVAECVQWGARVVLIDSVGEMVPLYGKSSLDNDDVTTVMRRTVRPLTETGCCVILIDHLPKNKETRNEGFSIGAMAKKRRVNGSQLRADVLEQPAPGRTGRVKLTITKDRTGQLRKRYPGKVLVATIASDYNGDTRVTIAADSQRGESGDWRPTFLMERVSRYLESNPEQSQRAVLDNVKGNRDHKITALERLIDDGFVERTKRGSSHLHTSVKPYREGADQ